MKLPFMHSLPQLPFLLIGTSARLEDLLRQAGLPVVALGSDEVLPKVNKSIPGRFVLFDSRNVGSRAEVARATKLNLQIVDVAHFFDGDQRRPASLQNEPRNEKRLTKPSPLLRLKVEIERCGGVWMRLGDYPFPHQSVLCSYNATNTSFQQPDYNLSLFERFEASAVEDPLHEIRQRYKAGLPLCIRQRGGADTAIGDLLADEPNKHAFPLLWKTSCDRFARWLRIRRGISFQLWKQRSHYEVRPSGDYEGFRPTLELWRGNHVAVLPLATGPAMIREKGIVFEQAQERTPGGFRSYWEEVKAYEVARDAS